MLLKSTTASVLLLSILINRVYCEGYYSIVGSKFIRPNLNYHVAVSLHESTEPCQMQIRIENGDSKFKLTKDLSLDPFTTQTIQFQMGQLISGDYKLIAEGMSGIRFKNETNLELHEKSFSVLIQTDKAIYKPGETVKFRVLILDPNMKPFEIKGPIKIYITDALGNRIKQWSNVQTNTGVFSNELPLSVLPVLGDWKLFVEVMGETKQKSFEVAEYVLPKFEVTIDTPQHQIYKDQNIKATIRAKYTYGKGVRGDATVSIQPKNFGYYQPIINEVLHRKTTKINGKGHVVFDIKMDLELTEEFERDYELEAIVEEELTGRKQSAKKTITLHKYKYTIKSLDNQRNYKPGLPFEITIQVAHHDGSPVLDSQNKMKISYGAWDESNRTKIERNLDSHGMVHITLTIPDDTNGVYVNAEYLGLNELLGYYTKSESESGAYLQAVLKTPKPTINKEVSVEILSTHKMQYFTYEILGRGDVILSKTETIDGKMIHAFRFMATFSMVPKARLVVYYFKNGHIISDHLNIEFDEDLQNFIKLEMSATKAKPGSDINITVNTRPNSYVGLLGVDQSVLLLKTGNDLSKDGVLHELDEYNEYYRTTSSIWRKKRYIAWNDDWPDFTHVGAVLLTNAKQLKRENHYYLLSGSNFGNGASISLEGAMAASVYTSAIKTKIRKTFPETWIWDNIIAIGSDGKQEIYKKVPDTITSWIITGFSVDPVTGLGLTKNPKTLEVFQPFFVSLNLPYSIKRGEIVSIPIVVFNYMENNVNAEVTLHNEDQAFDFAEITNEVMETSNKELLRSKQLTVKSNSGASTSFMIVPKKVGPITIKVTATSPTAGDGVERILLVEPEGVPQYKTKSIFVDLRNNTSMNKKMYIKVPKGAVPDSTRSQISVVGDLLGGTIKNLDSLIRMPYGCGEQNMLNFVPNIVVLNYLKSSKQENPAIEAKAKKFMESGYQRELTYKHNDGSFSAFGNSDKNGSTWLTAFVAKAFTQAANYIAIEERIIDNALSWLSTIQAPNGSFPEVGHVSHSDMQGGGGQGIALTAYTLITFLENKSKMSTYQNTINKAVDYLRRNIEKLEDNYSLALAAYALQLIKDNSKDFILTSLKSKALIKNGRKWWEKPVVKSDDKNIWHSQPNSVNVEMTSYGVLALLEAGYETECLPIVKWLLNQQNDRGGFQSTQDTVVGLQALAKFAEKISSKENNIQINIGYGNNAVAIKDVNSENSMILQSYDLPATVREVNISANGRGFAVIQLSYQYNENVTGASPRFTLDPQVNKNSNPDYLHLTVCTSFVPAGGVNTSNMAVMEVSFPSGFTADLDILPSLQDYENIKKVETKDGDTVVILYFNDLNQKEMCPTLDAFRTYKVAHQKPAPVTVYDYYDNSRRARMFYSVAETSLCDICENEDCNESCKIRAAEQKSHPDDFQDIWQQSSVANINWNYSFINLMILISVFLSRV